MCINNNIIDVRFYKASSICVRKIETKKRELIIKLVCS